ncbi:Gp37Gp68 family protein [Caldalkalibacillus thermarum TA2.A1]|uniref:Gp37Gp68 family protein n=1 Tax=Caldalkalibacillus thermarum (strain TA2.A1) TaxID=986075 RepID=F5L6M2_CALTT|nr:phage Gp37/Gp68 family protein [Caldalkalibacillus thermarum]EGL83029.1 Gp37Gp68 family protein [Caldalkalibacillus thermarum TA2.A1]QZT33723.1 phage Gp37/Gp68 family protein [Caldalkalibacillus thermarum TA2.A1]
MAGSSSIEWTEATWNPVTGCTKISEGCRNCYAARMAKRLKAMGNKRYSNGFKVTLHHDLIDMPLNWKKPKRIFVNSMSDLFHQDVPTSFIKDVFNTMNMGNWHQFQILTKRPERVLEIANELNWTPNIWLGVSVEDERVLHRIDVLKQIPAFIRFLSCEPLIGPLHNLRLEGIHWVIVGGESGPGARPMNPEWVRSIRDQCREQNVAFFFKQWGGVQKHRTGRILDNRTWDEYPQVATL